MKERNPTKKLLREKKKVHISQRLWKRELDALKTLQKPCKKTNKLNFMTSLKTWKPNVSIRQLQNRKRWCKNHRRSRVLRALSRETTPSGLHARLACSFRRPCTPSVSWYTSPVIEIAILCKENIRDTSGARLCYLSSWQREIYAFFIIKVKAFNQ